jgi:hypothetical protein
MVTYETIVRVAGRGIAPRTDQHWELFDLTADHKAPQSRRPDDLATLRFAPRRNALYDLAAAEASRIGGAVDNACAAVKQLEIIDDGRIVGVLLISQQEFLARADKVAAQHV